MTDLSTFYGDRSRERMPKRPSRGHQRSSSSASQHHCGDVESHLVLRLSSEVCSHEQAAHWDSTACTWPVGMQSSLLASLGVRQTLLGLLIPWGLRCSPPLTSVGRD